jgi:hypothetical protein
MAQTSEMFVLRTPIFGKSCASVGSRNIPPDQASTRHNPALRINPLGQNRFAVAAAWQSLVPDPS